MPRSALARLAGLPAVIVIGREHGVSRFKVTELLEEAQGESLEPLQEHRLGADKPGSLEKRETAWKSGDEKVLAEAWDRAKPFQSSRSS